MSNPEGSDSCRRLVRITGCHMSFELHRSPLSDSTVYSVRRVFLPGGRLHTPYAHHWAHDAKGGQKWEIETVGKFLAL